MPYIAAVTQPSWIDALQAFGYDDEVNFWRPGQQGISPSLVGSYMIFVRKGNSPRKIMGFAKIKGFETMTIRQAWDRWHLRNGIPSLREFIDSVTSVAIKTSTNGGGLKNVISDDQSLIGCMILRDVTLFTDERAPSVELLLPDFPKQVVSYKRYPEDFPPLLRSLVEQASSSESMGLRRYEAPDPNKIFAIDCRAMECVRTYCSAMSVEDVSTPMRAYQTVGEYHPGFDLLVRSERAEYHIEVKGTSLPRILVKVTRNEIRRAIADTAARLAIVSKIHLTQDSAQWIARGGTVQMYRWVQTERLHTIVQRVGDYSENGLSCKVDDWTIDPANCEFLVLDGESFPATH